MGRGRKITEKPILNKDLTDLEGEIWVDVEGFEGLYQVSNKGRVKSLERKRGNGTKPVNISSQWLDRYGYLKVTLQKDGKMFYTTAHRLVAKMFIANLDSKLTVNHIDGDKTNNCVENLEWVSNKENIKHAMDLGLTLRVGEGNNASKLTTEDVKEIKKGVGTYKNGDMKKLADKYGVTPTAIISIIKGRTWKSVTV